MKKLNLNEYGAIVGGDSNTTWRLSAAVAGAALLSYYRLPAIYIDSNSSDKEIRLYLYHHDPKKHRR